MTASPDRPSTARPFVVTGITVNLLVPHSRGTTVTHRAAQPPFSVWNLASRPALLTMWQHPVPTPATEVPLITELMCSLEPRRWRFDIEHLPAEVSRAFSHPDADAFQIGLLLDQRHVPPGAAAKGPVWPRVHLVDVPAPDRIPEDTVIPTVTLTGVAEPMPDRPDGRVAVNLASPDVIARPGTVTLSSSYVHLPDGDYLTWDDVDRARAESISAGHYRCG